MSFYELLQMPAEDSFADKRWINLLRHTISEMSMSIRHDDTAVLVSKWHSEQEKHLTVLKDVVMLDANLILYLTEIRLACRRNNIKLRLERAKSGCIHRSDCNCTQIHIIKFRLLPDHPRDFSLVMLLCVGTLLTRTSSQNIHTQPPI